MCAPCIPRNGGAGSTAYPVGRDKEEGGSPAVLIGLLLRSKHPSSVYKLQMERKEQDKDRERLS